MKHVVGDLIYWKFTEPVTYSTGIIEHGTWCEVDEVSSFNDCRVVHSGMLIWVRPAKILYNMRHVLDDMMEI